MADLFDFYERQLKTNIAALQNRINNAVPKSAIEVAEIQQISKADIQESQGNLAQLELELQSLAAALRPVAKQRISSYQETLYLVQSQLVHSIFDFGRQI